MKNNLARLVPAMERELSEANVRRQRRQAEEDMRSSEYKHRLLFENLCDAAFLFDAETGRICDATPQAETLLGRPRAEILGMREDQLYPPERDRVQPLRLLPAEVREQSFESNVLRKDGTIVPVRVSASKHSRRQRRSSWNKGAGQGRHAREPKPYEQ